jgi:hypothetical protein
VDALCFAKAAPLRLEFDGLLDTLFHMNFIQRVDNPRYWSSFTDNATPFDTFR